MIARYACFAIGLGLLSGPAAALCVGPNNDTPRGWARDPEAYADCLKKEAEAPRNDPLRALSERTDRRNFNVAATQWIADKASAGWMPDLTNLFEQLYQTDELSDEIQDGLRNRFEPFATQYNAAIQSDDYDEGKAEELMRSWQEVGRYLRDARDTGALTVTEKNLIEQLIDDGDIRMTMTVVQALLRNSEGQTQDIKDYIQEGNNFTSARLTTAINELSNKIAASQTEQGRRVQARRRIDEIAEYAAFADSLVELAAFADIIDAREAKRLSLTISGIEQLGLASVAFDKNNPSIGAYGLALGGALSLASALSSSNKTQSEQIFEMLQQISEQINDLQFSVDKGFEQVQTSLSETEVRLTDQLTRLFIQGDQNTARLQDIENSLFELTEVYFEGAQKDQRKKLDGMLIAISYADDKCLKKFNWFGGKARRECLDQYENLMARFTEGSGEFAGEYLTSNYRRIPYFERVSQITSGMREATGFDLSITPVNAELFAHLAGRIRVFVELNGLEKSSKGKALLERVDAFDSDIQLQSEALGRRNVIQKLEEAYNDTLNEAINLIEINSTNYEYDREINSSDEIVNQERNRRLTANSWEQRKESFTPETGALYKRITSAPDATGMLVNSGLTIDDDHNFIWGKVETFAAAAQLKQSTDDLLQADVSQGLVWVHQCNRQGQYPSFPVGRQKVAELFGETVAGLSLISKSAVSFCYEPQIADFRGDAGLGRARGRDQLRRQSVRFDQAGLRDNYNQSYFAYEPDRWHIRQVQCRRSLRQHVEANFTKFREFSRFEAPGCALNSPPKLYTSAQRITRFNFSLTIDLAGYDSARNVFRAQHDLPNNKYDRCFLPFDHAGQRNSLSILMPFRLQFPLPINQSCDGVDVAFERSMGSLSEEVKRFLEEEVRSTSDRRQAVTINEAAQASINQGLASLRDDRYQEILDLGEVFERLDNLADLLEASRFFAQEETTKRAPLYSSDIRVLASLFFVPDNAREGSFAEELRDMQNDDVLFAEAM